MIRVCTATEGATGDIGILLGKLLVGGEVIALDGELGAGKTAFTKGIALGLGITEYITSPTFALINEYEGSIPLFHFDVYRINDEDELLEIGFEDYVYGIGVSVIEWSLLTPNIIPLHRVNVVIEKVADDDAKRVITIEFIGEKYNLLEKKLTEEVMNNENTCS